MKIVDNRTKKTVAPINRMPCLENVGKVFADETGNAFLCVSFDGHSYRWISAEGCLWSWSNAPLPNEFLPINAHWVIED